MDSPTVPIADADSKRASSRGTPSIQQISVPPSRKNTRYIRKMALALRRASSWKRRPKQLGLPQRKNTARALRSRTASVVTLSRRPAGPRPAAADVDAEDETPADEKTSEEFWAQDESQLKLDPPPAPAAEDEAAAPDYAAFKGVKFSE